MQETRAVSNNERVDCSRKTVTVGAAVSDPPGERRRGPKRDEGHRHDAAVRTFSVPMGSPQEHYRRGYQSFYTRRHQASRRRLVPWVERKREPHLHAALLFEPVAYLSTADIRVISAFQKTLVLS